MKLLKKLMKRKTKKAPISKLTKKQLAYLDAMEDKANSAPAGATFVGSAMIKVGQKTSMIELRSQDEVLDLIKRVRSGQVRLA